MEFPRDHPRIKKINVPRHMHYSKRWADPSYGNRNFGAWKRLQRELAREFVANFQPLFPDHTPAKWNGTLTLK